MKDSLTLILLLLFFLAFSAAVFINSSGDRKPPVPTLRTATVPANAQPSARNVGARFLLDEQRLVNAVETNPSDTVAIRQLANFYHDAHRYSEAVELYGQYLAAQPDARQEWMDIAACYAQLTMWDMALDAMTTVIELRPDDPEALYNLGAIYANMGDFSHAATWWHKVLSQSADSSITALAKQSLQQLGAG